MLTEEMLEKINFDDILNCHAQVLSGKIETLHENFYKQFSRKYGLESIVFSVKDNEISRMYNVIKKESIRRRRICIRYGKNRVSDLNKREITEEERNTTQRLYLHILLPKTEKNRNIDVLVKLIRKCSPLDIHFILYQSLDSKDKFIDAIEDIVTWKVNEDKNSIINKIEDREKN